jgi:hypothetical protein
LLTHHCLLEAQLSRNFGRLPNKALLFKISFNLMLAAGLLFGRSTTV